MVAFTLGERGPYFLQKAKNVFMPKNGGPALPLIAVGDLSSIERGTDIHDGNASRCRQKQRSLQVGSHKFDEVIGGLFGGLRLTRHVIADVVFH